MNNTTRAAMRGMERVREKPAKLEVSNRSWHIINIGKESYPASSLKEIRVGEPSMTSAVDGLSFPIRKRVPPSPESVLRAAREVLEDPADVVIVSVLVMQALDEGGRNGRDEDLRQKCRRALAKIITPSSAPGDVWKDDNGRTTGTDCAFAHPLFLERRRTNRE